MNADLEKQNTIPFASYAQQVKESKRGRLTRRQEAENRAYIAALLDRAFGEVRQIRGDRVHWRQLADPAHVRPHPVYGHGMDAPRPDARAWANGERVVAITFEVGPAFDYGFHDTISGEERVEWARFKELMICRLPVPHVRPGHYPTNVIIRPEDDARLHAAIDKLHAAEHLTRGKPGGVTLGQVLLLAPWLGTVVGTRGMCG